MSEIADILDRAVETGNVNLIYDARPRDVLSRPVEVCVVGRRCVYVNDHRIAGGKPYVSENLPSHTLKTTVGEVLDCFGDDVIAAALKERKASRELIAAYHERRKAREQGL